MKATVDEYATQKTTIPLGVYFSINTPYGLEVCSLCEWKSNPDFFQRCTVISIKIHVRMYTTKLFELRAILRSSDLRKLRKSELKYVDNMFALRDPIKGNVSMFKIFIIEKPVTSFNRALKVHPS